MITVILRLMDLLVFVCFFSCCQKEWKKATLIAPKVRNKSSSSNKGRWLTFLHFLSYDVSQPYVRPFIDTRH